MKCARSEPIEMPVICLKALFPNLKWQLLLRYLMEYLKKDLVKINDFLIIDLLCPKFVNSYNFIF